MAYEMATMGAKRSLAYCRIIQMEVDSAHIRVGIAAGGGVEGGDR